MLPARLQRLTAPLYGFIREEVARTHARNACARRPADWLADQRDWVPGRQRVRDNNSQVSGVSDCPGDAQHTQTDNNRPGSMCVCVCVRVRGAGSQRASCHILLTTLYYSSRAAAGGVMPAEPGRAGPGRVGRRRDRSVPGHQSAQRAARPAGPGTTVQYVRAAPSPSTYISTARRRRHLSGSHRSLGPTGVLAGPTTVGRTLMHQTASPNTTTAPRATTC